MCVHLSFFKKEKKILGGEPKQKNPPLHFCCLNLKQLLKGEQFIEDAEGK